MKQKKKYFDILQVYRGIASLLVVIHHTYGSFTHFRRLDSSILELIASIGKYGVDFFFVLSGFIIAYTTYQYRDNKRYLRKYVFHRIIRIYIPYLPISIGMLLLYYLFPSVSDSKRSVSPVTSLFLIPHGSPALSVAWTLVYEIFFYLIYSLNFFSKKIWYAALVCWITGILVTNIAQITFENIWLKIVFNLYNFEFIFGVVVAYMVRNQIFKSISKLSIWVPIGLLVCFLLIKYTGTMLFPFSANLLFALTAAAFVFVGVNLFTGKIKNSNFWMLLGNSSYSLYLIHNPLQSILVRLVPSLNQQAAIVVEFLIVVLVCCGIAYLYYLIFEKHVMAFVKNKFERYVA